MGCQRVPGLSGWHLSLQQAQNASGILASLGYFVHRGKFMLLQDMLQC